MILVKRLLTLLLMGLAIAPVAAGAANCGNSSTGLVPLTDLGTGNYLGFTGGLYPGGSNQRPAGHDQAGINLGQSIGLLNTAGQPDPQGRIVFISIGMSNCFLEFNAFINWADGNPQFNSFVKLINCAQGGQVAETIVDPNAAYWSYVNSALALNGSSPAQVQVVWFKNANRNPTAGFPVQTETLSRQVGTIVRILQAKFPNLKQVYLSSRTYGGYASIPLSPEPYAYESGFAFKWIIEAQVNGVDSLNFDPAEGPVEAPWLSWGPYLWADGLTPRSDGLTWSCSQFDAIDGIHPNPSGQNAVASLMLNFFLTDPAATPWFRAQTSATPPQPVVIRLHAAPNPARRSVRISWAGAPAPTQLDIVDARGRRVRRLSAVGATTVEWDLRDAAGRRVPAAFYWVRPADAGSAGAFKLLVR